MKLEIKDDMIYSNELDSWVFIDDYLQMIVNEAAEVMETTAELKFVSAVDADDNHWRYPTIRTYTGDKAASVCKALNESGIPAKVDLYEDDDGDDDYGRPIIRRIWSVEIPSLKITDQIHDAIRSIEDTVYEWDSDLSKYVKTYYK